MNAPTWTAIFVNYVELLKFGDNLMKKCIAYICNDLVYSMTIKKNAVSKKNYLTTRIKFYHPLQSRDITDNCHNQNFR